MIGADGQQIGIVPPEEGLTRAREAGLDLVEIAPTARPPVCRILDFGKYLYTLEKEDKIARKKQKVVHLKEIKLTSKIKEHDYRTKLRNAIKFLERGDMVKLTMMFRGRELSHINLGERILNRFVEDVSDLAEMEKNTGLEGRAIVLHLQPKPAGRKKQKSVTKSAETQDEQSRTEQI